VPACELFLVDADREFPRRLAPVPGQRG